MITLKDVENAYENIKEIIKKTPQVESQELSQLCGANVYLKLENLQKTGSFKIRGAVNKIFHLSDEDKKRGLIASSAGNHAQGVALAAKSLGIDATIVMPKFAPVSKIQATKSYGVNVVLHGDTFDEAFKKSKEIEKEENRVFIHAFNDDEVIAGQGSIAIEIFEDLKNVDVILCPVGGGGILAGITVAAKEINPNIKIIGVQTSNIPSMQNALKNSGPISTQGPQTIADGIAVGTVGEKTYEIFNKFVDEVVTCNDDEIAQSILFLLEKAKVVAEGAGATALAALLSGKVDVHGKNVVVVISGGNIDVSNLEKIVNRAQILQFRRAKLNIILKDLVGQLSKITSLISENRANTLYLNQTRYNKNLEVNEQLLEIVIECVDDNHLNSVLNSLKDNNIKFTLE